MSTQSDQSDKIRLWLSRSPKKKCRHIVRKALEGLVITPKRGRPRGTEIEDGPSLRYMASLLIVGEVKSRHAAAVKAAADNPGQSRESTIKRLERKFKQDRPVLMTEAAEAEYRTLADIFETPEAMWPDYQRRKTDALVTRLAVTVLTSACRDEIRAVTLAEKHATDGILNT